MSSLLRASEPRLPWRMAKNALVMGLGLPCRKLPSRGSLGLAGGNVGTRPAAQRQRSAGLDTGRSVLGQHVGMQEQMKCHFQLLCLRGLLCSPALTSGLSWAAEQLHTTDRRAGLGPQERPQCSHGRVSGPALSSVIRMHTLSRPCSWGGTDVSRQRITSFGAGAGD